MYDIFYGCISLFNLPKITKWNFSSLSNKDLFIKKSSSSNTFNDTFNNYVKYIFPNCINCIGYQYQL